MKTSLSLVHLPLQSTPAPPQQSGSPGHHQLIRTQYISPTPVLSPILDQPSVHAVVQKKSSLYLLVVVQPIELAQGPVLSARLDQPANPFSLNPSLPAVRSTESIFCIPPRLIPASPPSFFLCLTKHCFSALWVDSV